jgi:hypothetical protein
MQISSKHADANERRVVIEGREKVVVAVVRLVIGVEVNSKPMATDFG